ncbi:MAG: hypothetical protein Q9221_005164 [Calogaya cf. arnoldii]
MSYIYEHAFAVYGWIGLPHDQEEIRLALTLMEKFDIVLSDALAKHNNDMDKVTTTIYSDNEDIFHETPDSECYKGWIGIKEIFQRSYWGRTWIYQEVTNTQDTQIFCGDEQFTLSLVLVAYYMEVILGEHPRFPERFRHGAFGAPSHLAAFRSDGGITVGDSLLVLLEYFRSTQCSEPRDKVYAVLGMAADLSSLYNVTPDYSKSLVDVYTDVVRFSLSQADHGLQVLGFYADEIIDVSNIWEHEYSSTAEVRAWAPNDQDNVYCPTGQTRDEAFRTTVLADMDVWMESRGYIVDWGLLNSYHHTLTAGESSRKQRMAIALKEASSSRRLCWTKGGRMGLAPAATQVGDLLFVLWGGQMMHVLRPRERGTFYYVGESYVNGVMDGELMTDKIGDWQTIVLE